MQKKQDRSTQTRSRLLSAALTMLHSQGVAALTLDGVAKEAGVSKGGLLHHFPSKDALITAMLQQLFADFAAQVQHYYDIETPEAGQWLRAYVRATFDEDPLPLEVAAMLLAALTENQALMTVIQADFQHWQARLLHDGVPRARATVIRQAADAYWMERLLGVGFEQQAERQQVMEELLQLSRGTSQ